MVLDPFAGNVVGKVAEDIVRNWISVDIYEEQVVGSSGRFSQLGDNVFK